MAGEKTTEKKPDGTVIERRSWNVSPEDILAIGAVLVALLVVAGMVVGKLPLNEYTYGLAGMSLAGAAIAKIVKAKKGTAVKK